MRRIRTYHEVDDTTGSEVLEQVVAQHERLARRLETVGRVVVVASGKGGVGKSAVTANLAAELARRGRRVGAVDADLNGPSLARMLGTSRGRFTESAEGMIPPRGAAGVLVASMEPLQEGEDAPLSWKEPGGHGHLWRGALETGALRELLSDVAWGELDHLLVDVPPGTDRIARLLELVPSPDAVLLVTTPSEMSRSVVARSARLLAGAKVPEVRLVGNMTEWVCPACGERRPFLPGDGVERLAVETGLDVAARIPFDPLLAARTDRGSPLVLEEPDSPASTSLRFLADLLDSLPSRAPVGDEPPAPKGDGAGSEQPPGDAA